MSGMRISLTLLWATGLYACAVQTGLPQPSTNGVSPLPTSAVVTPEPSGMPTSAAAASSTQLPTPAPGATPFPSASDRHPIGIALAGSSTLWIADQNAGTLTSFGTDGHFINRVFLGGSLAGVACDQSGNVWVVRRVPGGPGTLVKISPSGSVLVVSQAVRSPGHLAIDPQGRPWVTDTDSGVTVLTSEGKEVGFFTAISSASDIEFDPQGNAWIPSLPNWHMDKLTPSGVRLGEYGTPRDPIALAFDHEGDAWVLGAMPPVVEAYDPNGQPLPLPTPRSVDHPAFGNNVAENPGGLAIDADDDVWVTQSLASPNGAVRKLSRSGDLLGDFPVDGYPGQLVLDAQRNSWVECDQTGTVVELSPSGQRLRTVYAEDSSASSPTPASST